MDVGNIFKSLFRIYKTTKLLMQHHNSLHTDTHINKKYKTNNMLWLSFFLQVTLQKHPSSVQIVERRLKHVGFVGSSPLM